MRALVAASLATVLLAGCAGAPSGRLGSQALYDPASGMTFDAAGVWSSPMGRIHLRHLDYVDDLADDRGLSITQVGEYGERAELLGYGVAGTTPAAVYRVGGMQCPVAYNVVMFHPQYRPSTATGVRFRLGDCRNPIAFRFAGGELLATQEQGIAQPVAWSFADGRMSEPFLAPQPAPALSAPHATTHDAPRSAPVRKASTPSKSSASAVDFRRSSGPARAGSGLSTVPETPMPAAVPRISLE